MFGLDESEMKELIKAQDEYIDLLRKEHSVANAVAYVNGYKTSPTVHKQAIELREKINTIKSKIK